MKSGRFAQSLMHSKEDRNPALGLAYLCAAQSLMLRKILGRSISESLMMEFAMKSIIASCAALLFAAAAQADPYVAVSGGVSHVGYSCKQEWSCDKNDKAFKLIGGYGLNEFFGAEIGFYNLGKTQITGPVQTNNGSIVTAVGTYGTTGFGVGGAFYLDLAPKWRGIGRFGVTRMSTTLDVVAPVKYIGPTNEKNWGYIAGIDFGYMLTDKVSMDAGFDYGRHKFSGESHDVTIFSIGLTVSF